MKTLNVVKHVKGKKQEGATMIEYAVIAAIVVGIIVVVFGTLGDDLAGAFTGISGAISGG